MKETKHMIDFEFAKSLGNGTASGMDSNCKHTHIMILIIISSNKGYKISSSVVVVVLSFKLAKQQTQRTNISRTGKRIQQQNHRRFNKKIDLRVVEGSTASSQFR